MWLPLSCRHLRPQFSIHHRAGEAPAEAAARETWEETGKTLSAATKQAIEDSAIHNGVLFAVRLPRGSEDHSLPQQFDKQAANQAGSKTVQLGVVWIPVAQLRDGGWREHHMHFKGKVAVAAGLSLLERL